MDSTVLTHQDITNATANVDAYIATANGLYEQLTEVLSNLRSANWQGAGSDGYQVFFDSTVKPALTDNLTGTESSLTASIKSLLDNIQVQLLDTVDEQLGENNKNPGAGE